MKREGTPLLSYSLSRNTNHISSATFFSTFYGLVCFENKRLKSFSLLNKSPLPFLFLFPSLSDWTADGSHLILRSIWDPLNLIRFDLWLQEWTLYTPIQASLVLRLSLPRIIFARRQHNTVYSWRFPWVCLLKHECKLNSLKPWTLHGPHKTLCCSPLCVCGMWRSLRVCVLSVGLFQIGDDVMF